MSVEQRHQGIEGEEIRGLESADVGPFGPEMHSLMTDTSVQESVRALVAAANQRNIETIAERVENANEMAVLFQIGIHFMQGYYVHEPEIVLQDPVNVVQTSLEAIVSR